MKSYLFDKDPREIYIMVVGGKLKKFPYGYWLGDYAYERAAVITRFLIKDVLGWNEEDVKTKLSIKTFEDNKLRGMMACLFSESPFEAIDNAYPDRYYEWELKNVPINFWDKKKAVKATKWLIEEKLGIAHSQIPKTIKKETFEKYHLSGMLASVYNNSIHLAMSSVYPGCFFEWQFSRVSNGFWQNDENVKNAIRWVVANISCGKKPMSKDFKGDSGLKYMLEKKFDYDIDKALKFAGVTVK